MFTFSKKKILQEGLFARLAGTTRQGNTAVSNMTHIYIIAWKLTGMQREGGESRNSLHYVLLI